MNHTGLAKNLPTMEIVKRIKTARPQTAAECRRKCRLSLREIGRGCDRIAYRVGHSDVVVKFTYNNPNQFHSEHLACKTIKANPAYAKLRPLLPKVYFFDPVKGVTVMRRYNGHRADSWLVNKVYKLVRNTKLLNPHVCADIHGDNIRLTRAGKPKLIDMGMIEFKQK